MKTFEQLRSHRWYVINGRKVAHATFPLWKGTEYETLNSACWAGFPKNIHWIEPGHYHEKCEHCVRRLVLQEVIENAYVANKWDQRTLRRCRQVWRSWLRVYPNWKREL